MNDGKEDAKFFKDVESVKGHVGRSTPRKEIMNLSPIEKMMSKKPVKEVFSYESLLSKERSRLLTLVVFDKDRVSHLVDGAIFDGVEKTDNIVFILNISDEVKGLMILLYTRIREYLPYKPGSYHLFKPNEDVINLTRSIESFAYRGGKLTLEDRDGSVADYTVGELWELLSISSLDDILSHGYKFIQRLDVDVSANEMYTHNVKLIDPDEELVIFDNLVDMVCDDIPTTFSYTFSSSLEERVYDKLTIDKSSLTDRDLGVLQQVVSEFFEELIDEQSATVLMDISPWDIKGTHILNELVCTVNRYSLANGVNFTKDDWVKASEVYYKYENLVPTIEHDWLEDIVDHQYNKGSVYGVEEDVILHNGGNYRIWLLPSFLLALHDKKTNEYFYGVIENKEN